MGGEILAMTVLAQLKVRQKMMRDENCYWSWVYLISMAAMMRNMLIAMVMAKANSIFTIF